jgi:hypothetical protein
MSTATPEMQINAMKEIRRKEMEKVSAVKRFLVGETFMEWPYICNGMELWAEGKLSGVTTAQEKYILRSLAKELNIPFETYNTDWVTITKTEN